MCVFLSHDICQINYGILNELCLFIVTRTV